MSADDTKNTTTKNTATRDPKEWEASQWASPESERTIDEDVEGSGTPSNQPDADRWNKTEWVGDRGGGTDTRRTSPEDMPEGESALSGMRHNPGEQHWAERDRARDDDPS